ncbi:hypothetical protein BASA81_007146 [Batrachochytrium salamandrivorans]|nr:hypothetical protein BASA81_007146 [Batrachochytrium salamandrivorans]
MGGGSAPTNSTYTNVGKYLALDCFVPALQFLTGLCVGLIHEATKTGQDEYYEGGLGDLSESIEVWTRIDPHLLAAVFLPALIFSDAMQVDFHLFRRLFSQSFLLATVALSATDPVAVVAMLESVQAPAKLTTLMSGESHLSDLVALVSFNIFLATSVDVDSFGTEKLAGYVLSMIFGGPALGLGFGLLSLYIIRISCAPNNEDDAMIQLTVTIVCAYFSFIISENNVNGNGVLATVTSALVISAYAWPSFSKPQAIEQVWKTIEFFATAIIFCFGGLAFGMTVYRYHGTEYVPPELYGTCLFLWLMLYAVRAGVILILYPLLRKMGYGIRWNEALALTWGSLRGAVAIVLGLVMFETDTFNTRVSPADRNAKKDSVQFFFLVAGIVFLR